MDVGRPTDYKKEFDKQAYKLCLMGATDEDLADFFEVEVRTIQNWKKKHNEFFHSIKKGKWEADSTIAESLYHRGKGYKHKEYKVFFHEGEPVVVPITKTYPPDTAACMAWLKNRQPKKWRDKQDISLSNNENEPLKINISNMTPSEMEARINELLTETGVVDTTGGAE